MLDALSWFFTNLALGFYNIGAAIVNAPDWLAWTGGIETDEQKQSLMRVVFYGASVEFFFVLLALFLSITLVGWFTREGLWNVVRFNEFVLNWTGRIAAWAGLLMVLQQVMIVFLQRIFRASEISLGPLGTAFTRDVSWYSEELKFYNAIVVCLCVSWTFIQGGHVRVDLFYASMSHRAKRAMDMIGCMIFMVPSLVLIWLYAWFFFWRSMITPSVSASDTLERLVEGKFRAVRWNIETTSFSPNGFDAYFLFKVLILLFAATAFLQALTFFWRSWLEYREGELSAGRYLDRDSLGDETAERAAQIH
jgi:TRAP-type mannitol/chloroaromatic compound transport system permease small subunit